MERNERRDIESSVPTDTSNEPDGQDLVASTCPSEVNAYAKNAKSRKKTMVS